MFVSKTVAAWTAAAALALTATPAMALPQFTLAPSALGGTSSGVSNITADNILLSDYSTINFTSTGNNTSNFTESGTLAVVGFQLGSGVVMTPELNSTYGLYFSFTATGDQTNYTNQLSSGDYQTLNFTFYGYNKAPGTTVSYTPNNSTPAGVTNPVVLASGSLINGSVSVTGGSPSAQLSATFGTAYNAFFVSPVPFYNVALSAFTNTTSEVSGSNQTGFVITQGGGSANFATAVPEPMSLALLGTGLVGAGLIRRRKAAL